MSERGALAEIVAKHEWYHTLDLGSGVVTPGWFDLRDVVAKIPMPASLSGKRCLDVGTFDGFWAFEMERRGAAEVIAIDILDPQRWDWPAGSDSEVAEALGRRKAQGQGFEVAREALGSRVTRIERNVYDLDPATDGMFDFIYFGSLLLHLRDPVRALARAKAVCSGEVLVVDAIDARLDVTHRRTPIAKLDGRGRPWWWKPNTAGVVRMIEAAGFRVVGSPKRCLMRAGSGQATPALSLKTMRHRAVREAFWRTRIGDPHVAVLASAR